jgi:hypothetical protein
MSSLAADPVFQLNTVLWMLQPLPDQPGAIRPVLYRAGYRVRALGKPLSTPAEVERSLAVNLNLRGMPAPDVLASAPPGRPWLVFECKASSFGSKSSTSAQAIKILARAAELSLVAGSPPGVDVPGCVVYVTRSDQAADLQTTLDGLAARLRAASLEPASAGTLGMRVETGVGLIVEQAGGQLAEAAREALDGGVVVLAASGPEEDARPLYLVPFDPSVEQTADERTRCLRILLARARAYAASLIGRSPAPGTAVLEGAELLHGATFGLSKFWSDTQARTAAAHETLRFVKAALRSMGRSSAPFMTDGSSPVRIEVTLNSDGHRQECAEAIMTARLPEGPELPEFIADELPLADLS